MCVFIAFPFHSGLRGAIAYALSLHLEFSEETRHVLVTCTLVIVLFTIFILGGSTLPLLKVGLQSKDEQAMYVRFLELTKCVCYNLLYTPFIDLGRLFGQNKVT